MSANLTCGTILNTTNMLKNPASLGEILLGQMVSEKVGDNLNIYNLIHDVVLKGKKVTNAEASELSLFFSMDTDFILRLQENHTKANEGSVPN